MVYFAVIVGQAAIAVALAVHAATEIKAAGPRLERENRVVSALKLTDLCLFTEARSIPAIPPWRVAILRFRITLFPSSIFRPARSCLFLKL